MPVTDPIADMLTRIRNANAVSNDEAGIPSSRMKVGIAKILREEGFIKHYKVSRPRGKGQPKKPAGGGARREREKAPPKGRHSEIRVFLKYGPKQEHVIHGLERISKPGLRRYVKHNEIPYIQGGLGISILSTSKGLLTGKECRRRKIGGELLCTVW